ncbi:hypothetical protein CEQ20_19525 [Yersinia pseudotuberculosis]|nr:hypothetical protein CEQ20_19525 [Yersinia pseudotuberculosis]
MALQVGGQYTNPDELTQVSDSGEYTQPTPLQHQGQRVYPQSLALQVGGQYTNPDELTQVSDSGEYTQPTPLQRQGQRVY